MRPCGGRSLQAAGDDPPRRWHRSARHGPRDPADRARAGRARPDPRPGAGHLAALGVEVATGDVRDRASLAPALDGADVVVSAVHGFTGPGGVSPATVDYQGNVNLIDAARAAGAQLVLMSVAGAAADSPMELFRMKHAAEAHLRSSGVRWTIVRATAFFELWIDILGSTAARRAGRLSSDGGTTRLTSSPLQTSPG